MDKLCFEILSPVGRLEDLEEIIKSGADAIYVGLKGFSSRPMSTDLTIKEIKKAREITNRYGVKIYVAINGCIDQDRLQELKKKVKELDDAGVDALIIADWGLIYYIKDRINKTVIHASTLLGVFNSKTVLVLKKMGVKRIILSTNLYLDEIVDIINIIPELEYEIVADGGFCFNDNRQCELPHSSHAYNYQVYCQRKYDLTEEGINKGRSNPISFENIKTDKLLGLYMAMGINSYKIEGRTANVNDICLRTKNMKNSINYFFNHTDDFSKYLHYISRVKARRA